MSPDTPPVWPISFQDVLAARDRIRPFLPATPLRSYAPLDGAVGRGIRVLVKHENHNPTNSFKARNGLALLSALPEEARRRGVVAATRGNHGLGLAWAGSLLGAPVTICVPVGNNPEKNEAMRGYRVELIEQGRDYDEVVRVAEALRRERGLRLAHSTNDPAEIAEALHLFLRATHNLAEGAGAAGLAGLFKLRDTLAGSSVAVVLSGSNIDTPTLRRVLSGEL